MYLYLVPEAADFTYLIMDDRGLHHTEAYSRDDSQDILQVASNFLGWLKAYGLYSEYLSRWEWKQKER
jgi:hypothetical protein